LLEDTAPSDAVTQDVTPSVWIGLALALSALIAAALLAYRRRGADSGRTVSGYRRLIYAAGTFGIPITLGFWAHLVLEPQGWRAYSYALGAAVFIGAPILVFGLLDLLLGIWRPLRTRNWVVLGPTTFGAFTLAALILPGFFLPGEFRLNPRPLIPLIAAVAAGLVWWSLLPSDRHDVTGVFD
jgi:MFS family permease